MKSKPGVGKVQGASSVPVDNKVSVESKRERSAVTWAIRGKSYAQRRACKLAGIEPKPCRYTSRRRIARRVAGECLSTSNPDPGRVDRARMSRRNPANAEPRPEVPPEDIEATRAGLAELRRRQGLPCLPRPVLDCRHG